MLIRLDSTHHVQLSQETATRGVAVPVNNPDGDPIRVCRDVFSGDCYARIYSTRPSGSDPESKARAKQIDDASASGDLIHYSSDEPDMSGYWYKVDAEQIPNPDRVAADKKKASRPAAASASDPASVPLSSAIPASTSVAAAPAAAPAPAASFDPFAPRQ